jgi:hypothetical protein
MPNLRMSVTTEVVDDEEQHVVTAGAIITVTILITRFRIFCFVKCNSLVLRIRILDPG